MYISNACQINTLSDLFQDAKHFIVRGSNADWRTVHKYTPWPMTEFHSDTSFEINRTLTPVGIRILLWQEAAPSYSLLRMEEHPQVGGDTAWVSGYGLYDELSPNMQQLLEGLHAVHTSRFQYDTTIVSVSFLLWILHSPLWFSPSCILCWLSFFQIPCNSPVAPAIVAIRKNWIEE